MGSTYASAWTSVSKSYERTLQSPGVNQVDVYLSRASVYRETAEGAARSGRPSDAAAAAQCAQRDMLAAFKAASPERRLDLAKEFGFTTTQLFAIADDARERSSRISRGRHEVNAAATADLAKIRDGIEADLRNTIGQHPELADAIAAGARSANEAAYERGHAGMQRSTLNLGKTLAAPNPASEINFTIAEAQAEILKADPESFRKARTLFAKAHQAAEALPAGNERELAMRRVAVEEMNLSCLMASQSRTREEGAARAKGSVRKRGVRARQLAC